MPVPHPLATLIDELREPIAVDPASKQRLMELVREAPAPQAAPSMVLHRTPVRSQALTAIRRMRGESPRAATVSTLATAAGIALLMAVGSQEPATTRASSGGRPVTIGDSVASVASAIRDTLRIVQFMLTAPAASRVALAGDFNAWDPRATPLERDSRSGRWAVALALAPGRHNYAYVVDDTQWVRDPAAAPVEPNELTPPRSVLIINR
ncbi:MAG TPA: isoamylase early set domain-containing protein [Gemmatimonadaceae bacterium]|nr:isoamylase early set domain-containing protein [Gemmatimonadaceae bacterium]